MLEMRTAPSKKDKKACVSLEAICISSDSNSDSNNDSDRANDTLHFTCYLRIYTSSGSSDNIML